MVRRPTLSRRPVRLRFTALYGAVFLLSGVGLLAISGFLASGASFTRPVPTDPPSPTQARIGELQRQLADAHAAQARQLLVGSVIALAVMAVVSVVLGHLVAGRVLRPLRTMTAATRRISADNLHERLAVAGPADEVKDLADTIDELLSRLEGAFTAQGRFVANASHELRTPLATMRASLDVAMAKPEPVPAQTVSLAGRLRTELDQVDRLLEGFLTLARTQPGALPDRVALSLDDVVASALADRAGDLDGRDLDVAAEGAMVSGNRTLLRRLADNLVDNALRHGEGPIFVATSTAAGTARLVVESGGSPLDPRKVASLAQPFRRLGADRTGSSEGAGLGLSIVAAIASAHGGTLDLRARPQGGLRAEVALPGAAA
ncbi:HAMP domain-containing sensor histidine kinase [Actinomadura sp. DC4]|uniref:HAMP domain-containing sensor histidine kinase n=1 Tax=Actinomadura sp. DC4 TaxID=3055069 RepID=UPI0025B22C04|nr:HAMP domain-containing sensor histidine kinase [Actinomadura sp. DC4]MDN3352835.1 HAMP domain-containing sensor histidine kinase [Actinomadura sp. DC4]